MPNFWALPPEINSTRIYLGPGSGPILAAAQGWNALASELEKTKWGCSQRSTRCWSRIGVSRRRL